MPTINSADRLERIRLSHRRSDSFGLRPESPLNPVFEQFDPGSRLLAASRPVLGQLGTTLSGMMAGGLLTDNNGTVVDRYFGTAKMRHASDQIGAVIGASFTEAQTGTNAVSMALETRHATLVHSDEHFLSGLQGFTCYGAPIINPHTRRIEGVIDLMVEESTAPQLVVSLLDRAVGDILAHLVDGQDPDLVLSVAAFRSLSNRTQDAVTLIGNDFIVHNLKAARLITNSDADDLRYLADRLELGGSERIVLSAGHDVAVTCSPTGTAKAAMLRFSDGRNSRLPIPRRPVATLCGTAVDRLINELAASRNSVFIVGEPGSGRTRAARLVAVGEPTWIDSRELLEHDSLSRALQMAGLGGAKPVVIVDNVHLLPPVAIQALADHRREQPGVQIIATATSDYVSRSDVEYLASTFASWLELPPLRKRGADFRIIAEEIISEISRATGTAAGCRPELTKPAFDHLKSLPWAGNVAELHAMLTATLSHRSVGDIVVTDFPERYRRPCAARRSVTPMEAAERDLIVLALESAHFNKVHTAQYLGISRSKLYDRIRHFKIEIPE